MKSNQERENISKRDLSHVLSQVADLFGQKAKENLLFKCFGKHLYEIELF
jgi:hypothetical protein